MSAKLCRGWLLAMLLAPLSAAHGAGLDLAVEKSKESGFPLLVIGVTETCPYCVELEKRLTSEAELQPLVAQYVPVKLMVDDPEFAQWSRTYKPTGNGVPMIFIVGSDGKEIANVSGAPQGEALKQLLQTGIEKTGGLKEIPGAIKTAAGGIMKPDKTLRIAKKLLARDQKAAAIEALTPLLKERSEKPQAKGSELDALVASLTDQGLAELNKARAKAEQPDGALLAAVMQARVRRVYGELPDVATALDEFTSTYKADAEKSPLLEQARLIDKAREFDERKSPLRAAAAYQQVIDKYPNTEAARLSELRMGQLGPAGQRAKKADLRTWSDATGAFKIEASLEKLDGQTAVLRKADGKIVRVPLEKLSEEDRSFVAASE